VCSPAFTDQAHVGQITVGGPVCVERLGAFVRSRVGGRVRNLHVVAAANGVVLRGRAATYYAKQLAQHAVMEATDLPIVANEIEVV
jgi:hypothetical protein